VVFATRAFLQYELACHCFLLARRPGTAIKVIVP
jgi:hypothetical protein